MPPARLPLLLIALTGLLAGPAFARDGTAQPEPSAGSSAEPIDWPASPRPSLETRLTPYDFDGMTLVRFEIDGEGLHFGLDPLAGWSKVRPSERESLALAQNVRPDHRLSFAVFDSDEFLKNLESKSIRGYVAGLREAFGEGLRLLNEEKYNPRGAPFIFGTNWRFIDYTVQREGESKVTRYRDYLLFPGDKFMIIRQQGPPELVDSKAPFLMRYLSRYTDLAPGEPAVEGTAGGTPQAAAGQS